MSEFNILKLSISDFFSSKMMKLIFIPFVVVFIIISIGFFFFADYSFDAIANSSYFEHNVTTNASGDVVSESFNYTGDASGFFGTIIYYIVTSTIFHFIIYTLSFVLIIMFSNFLSLVILGFLTGSILEIVRQRHYPEIIFNGYGNVFNGITKLIKTIFIFLFIFLCMIPILFIPGLNIIAFHIPFYYLFHELLIFDVGSTVSAKKEFERIYYINRNNLRFKTFLFFLASLIPFGAIFITLFFMIYVGHSFINMKKLEQLTRNEISV